MPGASEGCLGGCRPLGVLNSVVPFVRGLSGSATESPQRSPLQRPAKPRYAHHVDGRPPDPPPPRGAGPPRAEPPACEPQAAAADVLPQLVFSQLPEAAAALGPGQASDNNPPDSVRAGDGRLSSAASEATEDAECVATLAEVRGAAGASGPSGWRMLELTGAPEAPAGRAERGGRARAALRMGRQASWRDTEVAGACECPSVMESPRQQEPEAAPRAAPRWPVPPVPLPSGVPLAPLPRGEAGPGGAPPSDSPRREEDWRWDELCGAGTARGSLRKAVAVQRVESSSASSGKRPGRRGQRMQWRDAEVLAAHSAVHRAQPEATPASAEQPATGSAAIGHGAGEAAASAGEAGPQRGDSAEDVRPHEGDIVRISADPDYSQRSAVVTKVGENHCTVVVLDASERFGVDERYPYFKNIRLVSSAFRLRNRVAVAGLKGARTRHLNGHTGSIERHPTNGHPVFVTVQKPPAPDKTQLIFCVRLDDPASPEDPCVLLEPRFLQPCEDHLRSAARDLGDVIAQLTGQAAPASPAGSP